MPLTTDRNTPSMEGELLSVPVAASTTIYAGSLVVANASGYAAAGSTATTLQYLGRAEEKVDNSAGANGAKSILVRRKQAFKWGNYASDAIVQADLGKTAYIYDDAQVAKTSGGSTRSIAGKILQIDADGVWIE